MKVVIVILLVLLVPFLCGAALALISSDMDDWDRMMEDRDQAEYLRKWEKTRKDRKKQHRK